MTEVEVLEAEVMHWRRKYHEARMYLRAANKGAELNNKVCQLQVEQIFRLRDQITELQEKLNGKHR